MNETLKTITELRTVHGAFAEKEITNADLQTILNSAICAANASARQSYSIVVVEDKEVMKKLSGYSGSRLLLFCVDFNRICDVAAHLGHKFEMSDVTSFITGSTDTVLAAQTAAIAAKSLGIDSLFTNGIHRGDMNRVYEILDLPKEKCFPLIALVLGYAEEKSMRKKGRITKGVVHYNKYSPLSDDERSELVAKYDEPSNHLGLFEDWRGKYNHYLDWFYEEWSGKGDTDEMTELLKQSGFLKR